MKKNFTPKYKYYVTDNKVVAVSTYAKKNVRGVAVCSSEDTFNVDFGKRLARIRCDKKINRKRLKNLNSKIEAVDAMIDHLVAERNRLEDLINDTCNMGLDILLEENCMLTGEVS